MKKKEEEIIEVFNCSDGNVAMKTKKGLWIYKSINVFKIGTNILKKKEHDKPRYKIIYEIEASYKTSVNDYLATMIKDVAKKMKQMIK